MDTEVAFLTLFKHALCLESSWPLHHPKGPQSLQSVCSRGAPCWEDAQEGLWEPRLQVEQARLACGSSGFKGNRAALPVGAQPSGKQAQLASSAHLFTCLGWILSSKDSEAKKGAETPF